MQSSADVFYSFPRVIDLTLNRMKLALADINLNLPPVIHIAGTNGKGSSLAFLRAILEAGDKKCHAYTSPHLVTIHERYVLAGEQISEPELLDLALRIIKIAEQIPLTIFEAETLAGFMAFSQNSADYLLLETGLGGRLDATNAIDNKKLTIISPIDFDHKEYLGDDIRKIAREKCGIMRPNTPVIVARQREEVLEVIEEEATKIGAPIFVFGRDFDAYMSFGKYCFQTNDEFSELPIPALKGAHQLDNAAIAIMAARLLGSSYHEIALGLANAHWPARLQKIDFGKFGKLALNNDCEIWLDGGHNPHGAIAAANFIGGLQEKNRAELILITGLLSNKDIDGFFHAFAPLKPKVFCVPIAGNPNAMDANDLAKHAQKHRLNAFDFIDFSTAILNALSAPNRRIIICGSLYLAGEVLALNSPN